MLGNIFFSETLIGSFLFCLNHFFTFKSFEASEFPVKLESLCFLPLQYDEEGEEADDEVKIRNMSVRSFTETVWTECSVCFQEGEEEADEENDPDYDPKVSTEDVCCPEDLPPPFSTLWTRTRAP